MRNHQACESEFPRVSIAQKKRDACFFFTILYRIHTKTQLRRCGLRRGHQRTIGEQYFDV